MPDVFAANPLVPDVAPRAAAQLLKEARDAHALARSYRIDSQGMREAAAEDLREIVRLKKQVDAQRKDITAHMDKAKAAVMDLFRPPMEYLENAQQLLTSTCLRWDAEIDRKRREAEAEAARVADEARKKLEAEAEKQAAAGQTELAHVTKQAALFVAPVPVEAPAKIAGQVKRTQWSAEVVDLMALVQAVAAGTAPANCLEPNLPFLNAQARSLKAELRLPGVVARSEEILGMRT